MSRVVADLHPVLQEKIKQLIELCLANGLKIGIGECVRTVAEQDELYSYGRTNKSRGKVTNAKGSTYSSMHQWKIAFDFYRNDGKGAYYDNDGFFTKVGKLGQSINLEWGGSWKSIVDKPHFQLPDWGSTPSKLKKLYSTPDKFMASWNTKNEYVPTVSTINQNSSDEDKAWLQTKLNEKLVGVEGFVKLEVDSDYGKKTIAAVVLFYKLQGWKTDGMSVGKFAIAKLRK
jgi:peptidoglycan L-alanyl-D-glutamate endopeptidase CwlK